MANGNGKQDLHNRIRELEDIARKVVEGRRLQGAIAIYEQILAQCPEDDRARIGLKLSDCYLKIGDATKAVAIYFEVARLYEQRGFYLKAVAIYKSVLRIDEQQPENTKLSTCTIADAWFALAECLGKQLHLYQDASNALENFLRYAEPTDERIQTAQREIANARRKKDP